MKKITKMENHGTTLFDIYEAAGADVNEDRTHATINPGNRKPFKIELLVYPIGYETNYAAPDEVTLGIILADEVLFEEDPMGTRIMQHAFDAQVKLPISQVKIIKE